MREIELWAGGYDLPFEDLFAIQDEIADRVAGAIEPELLRTEASLAVSRHTGNAVARVSAGLIAYGWSDDAAADSDEGLSAGLLAVRLDERDPYAHYALAIISNYSDRIDQAQRAAERAIELNPSFALGHLVLGLAQLFGGKAQAAAAALRRGLGLSPHDPQNFVWLILLAHAERLAGHHQEALEASLQSMKVRPGWGPSLEAAACCHVTLGHHEQAKACLQDLAGQQAAEGNVLAPLWRATPDWQNPIAVLRIELPDTRSVID